MNIAVLIPVKDLTQAKTRLSPLLTEQERSGLAHVMLLGVLEQIALLPAPLRKVMITSYGPAIDLARKFGMELIEETQQISESASVDAASATMEADGVDGVLRVPLDLPLLNAADLDHILKLAREGRGAVLVPSLEGTGTNGLYRSPPTVFPSRFGPGSLALHTQAARERTGGNFTVLPLESMALDIDEPQDLRTLLQRGTPCPARDYLEGINIHQRLETSSQ